jgi:hypothetical protein
MHLLLVKRWANFIITKGKVVKNKFFWDLDGIPSDNLGIVNIYAPDECKDRCKL